MMLRGLESDFKIPKNLAWRCNNTPWRECGDKAPDLTGVGAPSGDMLERTVTAVRIKKDLMSP